MTSEIKQIEERKLKNLIREYSNKGYEVFADYLNYTKPERMDNFTPDLVVKKDDEIIIIEIVTRENIKKLEAKIKFISEYSKRHNNVRFDLVFTNPRKTLRKEEKLEIYGTLFKDSMNTMYRTSTELYKSKQYYASFLIIYNIIEILLSEIALKNQIYTYKTSITVLSNILLDNNIISTSNYRYIQDVVNQRNKIVHNKDVINKNDISVYLEFISNFIKARTQSINGIDKTDKNIFPAPEINYYITQKMRDSITRIFPDVGFNIYNNDKYIAYGIRVAVAMFLGGQHIGYPESDIYYNGSKIWNLNPSKGVYGHFKAPDYVVKSTERFEVKVTVEVVEPEERSYEFKEVGWVYQREKNQWYFEP